MNPCTPTKPSHKQRNYLIKLTTRNDTALTNHDLCCGKHASNAITKLKGKR